MTAREIFKKCVYNPMPDGKEYEKELYENCLNMEMAKHISHAQIEGPEYYPKAIAKLRHKIVDEALNIHNYWSRIANDKQEIFGVSDLSTLLDWIDSKLNASDNETRGMLEKAYGRELFVFVLNMAIINRLQARLDSVGGDEGTAEKKEVALELLHALREDVYWKSTIIDKQNKGVIKCTDESWLALFGLLPKTDSHRIEWLVETNGDRSVMPLAELLIEIFGEQTAQDKLGFFVDHCGKMKWDNNYKLRHMQAKSHGTTSRNIYFRDIHPKIENLLQRWNNLK